MSLLDPASIRLFIKDHPSFNHLLEGVEFTDTELDNYTNAALQMFNITPPISSYDKTSLPANTEVIVLHGTLAHAYLGRAAMAARNQLSYSDGGLTIPIEERYQYYSDLAQNHANLFNTLSKNWKIGDNMGDKAWGSVGSDYSRFPQW